MSAQPFDPTLKALVEIDPASWLGLLGRPHSPTTVIDSDIATVSGAGDKVLHVATDPPHIQHLEFVAGHDAAQLPGKLRTRNGLLEDRHQMLVRSAVVLLRPEADSRQMTGVYERQFPGEATPYLRFRYQVVRVWELAPSPLLRGSPALLPLAPISAVTEAELPDIIEQMEQRLGTRRLQRQAPTIWSASFILFGLRYSPALAAELFRRVVSMKESSTYQMILEEGRTEGLLEGRTEGAISEARKALRLVGDIAFGTPDKATASRLERLELEQLEALLPRVPLVKSWQELLGPPASGGRGTRRRPSPKQ